MKDQTELNRYCKEVRRALKGSPKYKASVQNTLRSDIEAFLAENPDATAQDIRQHFGEPANFARESAAAMDSEELSRKLSVGKKVFITVVAGILTALIMWACGLAIAVNDHRDAINGYSTYEIIE